MEAWVPLIQTAMWILLIIAAAIFLRSDVRVLRQSVTARLSAGSSMKFGPVELGELKEGIAAVKDDVHTLNARITNLFLLTMSVPMFENLRKLSSGSFGPFEKSTALERELRHLRDLGYVIIPSVREIPSVGTQLSDFVQITEAGVLFVELRRQVQDAARA